MPRRQTCYRPHFHDLQLKIATQEVQTSQHTLQEHGAVGDTAGIALLQFAWRWYHKDNAENHYKHHKPQL